MTKFGAMILASIVAWISASGSIVGTALTVEAEDTVLYDAADETTFSQRTLQDVADAYSQALYISDTYDNYDSSSWYATPSSTTYPYAAGELTEDTHATLTALTNFYRWLVGSQPLTNVSTHSEEMQAGALVRNFEFDHFISDSNKPSDMDDALWTLGADCKHNVLASGYTPTDAIKGWMSEGYSVDLESWSTIGHRAMMMQMRASQMEYGYSGRVAIGLVTEYRNTCDLPFTAFPAPGYMPASLVEGSECAWSVELNNSILEMDDEYDVTVTITNLRTQEQWVRTAEDETLMSSYGCLVFVQPTDYVDNTYTDAYEVVISGLTDVETGKAAQAQYTVNFFPLEDYATSRIHWTDFHTQYGIAPSLMQLESLEKIAAILPTEIPAKAENGNTYIVPVTGHWQVDMEQQCFYNTGDTSALPWNIKDALGKLERVTIPFYEKSGYTALYDSLTITPAKATAGDDVSFSVFRTNVSTDRVQIYQLTTDASGTYQGTKRFDSYDSGDTGVVQETYTMKQVTPADAGTYISVYFNQSWIDGGNTVKVFVSNTLSTLSVEGISGDVSGDGKIDVADMVALKKVLTGMDTTHLDSADCNGDGTVNVFDLICLKELLDAA
jgi:hypothetical protein